MEELCTLINVLQNENKNEDEEEASLLWTALHSLLTEDKEDEEEMLAWLQATPRFETIVFCSLKPKSLNRSESRDTAVRILLQRKDDD